MDYRHRRHLPEWFPVDPTVFAWDAEMKAMGKRGIPHKLIAAHIERVYRKSFSPSRIGSRLLKMGVSTQAARGRVMRQLAREAGEAARKHVIGDEGFITNPHQFQKEIAKNGRGHWARRK